MSFEISRSASPGSGPSSVAVASPTATRTTGSSAIVTVADVPSAVNVTVSDPSRAGWKIGVSVTVVEVCPAGIRTLKNVDAVRTTYAYDAE